ncbi:MAG: DMT family transporter [Cypionkella sp.]|nr:DMT family transporter [Cypionkella sp.]
MSIGILLAVLGAAFLHAAWNAAIKVGSSRMGAMVLLSVGEMTIGLAVAAFLPLPPAVVWPWIAASSCAHFMYKFFLAYAYERGDLSRVYPIARGAAPMIVAIVGAALLPDVLAAQEYLGIFILGLGILAMAQGVFTEGENRKLLPFAIGSAIATACYTMIDGSGARISGNAISYIAWVFVVEGALFLVGIVAWRGAAIIPRGRRDWAAGMCAAVASYGAYAISVWAMTKAPIAVVAALRETSILFAVLIGWAVFGERISRGKILAAALIVSGVIATRL